MWTATLLMMAVIPQPSEATMRTYAIKSRPMIVRPNYVFRVWSADWCSQCKTQAWQDTIIRLDAIPRVGIQRVNYNNHRTYAKAEGIYGLPAIQLYEFRYKKPPRVIATRVGRTSYTTLRRLLPK